MNLIGQILKNSGDLSDDELLYALEQQKLTKEKLGYILVSGKIIESEKLEKALAKQLGIQYIDLDHKKEMSLESDAKNATDYIKELYIPLDRDNHEIIMADVSKKRLNLFKQRFGADVKIRAVSKFQLLYCLHLKYKETLSHLSVYALAESYPNYSAGKVILNRQLFGIFALLVGSFIGMIFYPWELLLFINIIITIFLIVSFFFKLILVWVGSDAYHEDKVSQEEIGELRDTDLPIYSIIVPLYKEPEVLPIIINSLSNLNYPKTKLDIKIVLEEDDLITQKKAQELDLNSWMEVIIVPHSIPKTKPKACNYALQFSRGEFVVIYDAEDKPHPDQLKAAICLFKKSPEKVSVIQARLNFFNANENWLTRMFAMEYGAWFDFYLPALEKLKIPIPLGGTSNHFKMEILRAVGAWDPFNVTEDADLGIRMSQMGLEVRVLASTTLEEANTRYINWIRQRSRWMKGYMQTYLVHMRNPLELWKKLGLNAFFGFQFFIGGSILTALITPWLYSVFVWWWFTNSGLFNPIFIEPLHYLSTLNFLLGNSFFIYVHMMGVVKRKNFNLSIWALFAPLYWIMMSVAAYRGLIQLIANPFYWDKTEHGLSKMTGELIENAKSKN